MYAIIRLRGSVNTKPDIKDTLKMLRLNQINHCVVVPDTPSYRGMIHKVKDYVAYGPINGETLAMILENRGRLVGGARLTDDYVARNSPFKTIKEFAEAVASGKAALGDLPGLNPVFRMHPPRKGHAGIKRTFQQGGALGNNGEEIATLVKKMR
ncbi:LSU ribosomal protein L30P [Methanocella conradii HZ254]|uniref:Large ribosomal subunit protein uL30 n=1 Tax=Methanocella conradii (strain DSM 24694 / JCM 17849 / CGMCC 1.5162 / HZ254) TaxID=1041930 RepID=H8IAK1_METCZ|nr:50S ribosomal protein L30 [Methanocella conradii]AFD00098.1 LSU ribosomal protein L30P [Methanocella conradii HZ254]MDI6896085.1 50S ribosomal protein L30 [Methanocella conradii]